jgi:hypothetical protein
MGRDTNPRDLRDPYAPSRRASPIRLDGVLRRRPPCPLAKDSVVSPRLADGCFARRMQEPSHSGPAPCAALLLFSGIGRALRPEAIVRARPTALSRCAESDHAAIAGPTIASMRLSPRSLFPARPTATPAAVGASRDRVELLTRALLLPQERGRQARADRDFRCGRFPQLNPERNHRGAALPVRAAGAAELAWLDRDCRLAGKAVAEHDVTVALDAPAWDETRELGLDADPLILLQRAEELLSGEKREGAR